MEKLKISEFAQLTGISRQNLIFYAKEGVLSPAYVDPNNSYRYYTYQQVDWASAIVVLRECGVSLEELKKLNHQRTPDSMLELFKQIRSRLSKKINQLSQLKDLLGYRQKITREAQEVPHLPYAKVVTQTAVPIFKSSSVAASENDWLAFQQFIRECQAAGIPSGIPISTVVDQKDIRMNRRPIVSNFFYRPFESSKANDQIPAGQYALLYCHASYENTAPAYQLLHRFLDQHHYQLAGDVYQDYLIDEVSSSLNQEYVLRLTVPIRKLSH